MGQVNFGVPKDEVDFLKRRLNLLVFVEGGTYKGWTAKNMSSQFQKVYTIEKSEIMFDIAKENLEAIDNVVMCKGDTRDHLHHILKENDNILFWLDAHWSGGKTYGNVDECPLIKELEIIFEYEKNQVILIDDARLFLAPPPSPHDYKMWPSLLEISNSIPKSWDLTVYEDVIYIFPKIVSDNFKLFLQNIITSKHKEKNPSFLQNILNKLR